MQKLFLLSATMISLQITPGYSACIYPLDATQEQYDMLNLMATPDNILHLPTVAAQNVEFLIQGTGTSRSYAAHSAAGVDSLIMAANDSSPIGDISFPEAGISAVELRFDNIPEIQAGIENLSAYEFGLSFYSGFVGNEPAGDALSGSFSVMNIRNYSGSLQSFIWVRFV